MKVALVSDHASQGGAAIACNRLAVALAGHGATIARFSLDRGPRPRLGAGVEFAPQVAGRRATGVVQLLEGFGLSKSARSLRLRDAGRLLPRAVADWRPDVINLHNLHGFDACWHSVEALAEIAPIVWTLHDMWSFTGRCTYAYECRRFESGCTAECPTAGEYPALRPDLISAQWQQRARFFQRHTRVSAIAPSRWLADEARRGLWRNHRVEAIPNSLDLDTYAPIEADLARIALGLPPRDGPTLLFVADYLTERRKGGPLVAPALAACDREITVWTLGHGEFLGLPPNVRTRSLGYVSDERMKALIYAAADVLVHPAPVDNYPNTIAESLACGTPVVAFRTGGIPEMLVTEACGRLVDPIDAEALHRAIDGMLAITPLRWDQKIAIRNIAASFLSPHAQASAYLDFFARAAQPFLA